MFGVFFWDGNKDVFLAQFDTEEGARRFIRVQVSIGAKYIIKPIK
jgi:hypothetical protein